MTAIREITLMGAEATKLMAKRLVDGISLAGELFERARSDVDLGVEALIGNISHEGNAWERGMQQAQDEIASWNLKPGQKLAYEPADWMLANIARRCANEYQQRHQRELTFLNYFHQNVISEAMRISGLDESLIKAGKEGYRLAVVETSSRLAPVLTFPGASSYLCVTIVPYAREARTVLGESHEGRKHFISEEAVRESAENAHNRFGAKMVLAETSAAPRFDVPKSGRKPEVYIASVSSFPGANRCMDVTHHIIDTPFREEFDAQVRELMFLTLRGMYK
jgi:nicotinamide mononucleotide (NMN) deamidase PncC